jgi:lipopolysaccharide exporter
MTGVGVMTAFLSQFDNLVVGRVLGETQLGFYSIATSIPVLVIFSIAVVAGQVLFPAFAQLDSDALRRGVLTSLNYLSVLAFPLAAFLIVMAEPLTISVFGPHWHGAVATVRVLALLYATAPINMVCGNAFFSRGKARLVFMLGVPQAAALVVGSLLLVHYGIVAVAWVQATIGITAQAVTLIIARRMFKLTIPSLLKAFLPPLFASLALAGVLLGVSGFVTAAWPEIIGGAISGGVVYLTLLHVLSPELLPGIMRMVFARRSEAHA